MILLRLLSFVPRYGSPRAARRLAARAPAMPPPAARRRRLSDSDLACATTKRRFAALDIYAKATATSAGRSRHELVRLGELKPARRHSFDWLQFCRDGNRCQCRHFGVHGARTDRCRSKFDRSIVRHLWTGHTFV